MRPTRLHKNISIAGNGCLHGSLPIGSGAAVEKVMKSGWIAIAVAGMAVVVGAADAKQRAKNRCVNPPPASLDSALHNMFALGLPEPVPNGCSPAVYQYNKYIGQDPDPNIRFQLMRDPATGNPEFY
jgi:hypothetical protein